MFIDGIKQENQANRYTFVWRKTTEKYLAKVKDAVRKELANRGVSDVTLKKCRELVKSKRVACELQRNLGILTPMEKHEIYMQAT